jgi:methylenetetrahydrofolate dehydrogenase (NADP+)/methenyltetrahydrofolate cyclohydrolase
MKSLNGRELAGYIKERQAHEVRALRQSSAIEPKLAIVVAKDDPVIETYIRLKKAYGQDILIEVDIHRIAQPKVPTLLKQLNGDSSVHGIIVQLPLADVSQTDEIVNLVAPEKDVDALGTEAIFEPATPMAILWLLAGYNVDLRGKKVLLVGRGKLVGAPLEKLLKSMQVDVKVVDREATDLSEHTQDADVIITATGSPAILYSDMIKQGAVVVDAGVASESGKTVGDLEEDVYTRDDLTITPKKGGVGPLTVCALFDNVIRAARNQAGVQEPDV